MVVIEMENGKKIKIELYPEIAPITCANFEKLVKEGVYDGLIRAATPKAQEWAAQRKTSRANLLRMA